jgi:uncharacterized protein (DUF885 family)
VSHSVAEDLTAAGRRFFHAAQSGDPLNATLLGVEGFDDQLGDPSRAGTDATVRELRAIHDAVVALDGAPLDDAQRTERDVLRWLVEGSLADFEHSLWEGNASAAGYVSPQSLIFQAIPAAPMAAPGAVDAWLTRLRDLPAFIEAIGTRYRVAAADGRPPTAVGVAQALTQLDQHLRRPVEQDVLVTVPLPADSDAARQVAAELVESGVRPALQRLAGVLDELRAVARDDDHVGISEIAGGAEGYRAAVRRHTTTDLTPEQIHRIGLDVLADLESEWAEVGARALGTDDGARIRARLRDDPSLRFESSAEIVAVVRAALERAEAAQPRWFPELAIGACAIEEIDPAEADNAALAYYRPPSADGSRPGAHCILTTDPQDRFSYEYETLAFHESVPGHHLSIASAQQLTHLPPHRRYVDAQLCAFIEGWGLYSERLADEMGLYSSDLARLGMLSFDALRACRLVVDTGMHALGWSRTRAAQFMWDRTATTRANVRNEIDRYIGWPGQALSYLIGRREIRRQRELAWAALGERFDVREFHGVVLGEGPVPLPVLADLVERWVQRAG